MRRDYVKIFATQRHIAETVFNRAAENKVRLEEQSIVEVFKISIHLAMLAHVGEPPE